ncbi:transcription factor IIF subunit tfg1, partial [Linderina macrospora]
PKTEDQGLVAAPVEDKRACTDYRLVSSAHERTHNVMRFLTSKPVDVTKFTQPVKLTRLSRTYYRRKAEKARAAAEEKRKAEEEKRAKETGMEIKEEAEPAAAEAVDPGKDKPKADTSIIAPYGGATRNKQMLFKKRTKQVFFADEEQRRLNIEEARPWVLEDYDEKESWNGTLEGGQKSDYVLFVLMDDGFKVVPVDRWYKFMPKLKYQTLTLDEAEEELKKAAKNETQNRWLMKNRTKQQGEEDEEGEPAEKPAKKSLVEYDNADEFDDDDDDDNGGAARKKRTQTKHGDADEMDFDEEFADDEEMGDDLFGNDEDEADKQQQKNKKSELDSDVEEEDEDELGLAGKEMKKLMRKREENDAYDSDGEENPYLSVSEVDSDEEEQQPKTEEDKKDASATANAATTATAAAASSSAPTKEAVPKAAAPQKGQSDVTGATSAKKRKRPAPSAHNHSGDPRKHAKTAPKPAESDDLITEKEVIDLIRSGVTTTKALIGKVRSKLKANPTNKARIQTIVRTVAILKDGNLSLKKRS